MTLSREFCEMLKTAYNDEMDGVDFYTRMAQIAPSESISRALIQMSRDELRHSYFIDSIMSLATCPTNSVFTTQECNCPYAEPTYTTPVTLEVPTLQPATPMSAPMTVYPEDAQTTQGYFCWPAQPAQQSPSMFSVPQTSYQMPYDNSMNMPIPSTPDYMVPATQMPTTTTFPATDYQQPFHMTPEEDMPAPEFMVPATEKLLVPEPLPDPEPESKCPKDCGAASEDADMDCNQNKINGCCS